MVMSIREEIQVLEEEKENCKGPGSRAKKEEIQERIDELKSNDVPNEPVAQQLPPGVSDDDLPGEPGLALPKHWIKVSVEEVLIAQENGTLCGYDPDKGIALIR